MYFRVFCTKKGHGIPNISRVPSRLSYAAPLKFNTNENKRQWQPVCGAYSYMPSARDRLNSDVFATEVC